MGILLLTINGKAGGTSATGSGPCWNTASQYSGKYSKNTNECVQCSGKYKVKILGDASSIYVNCDGSGSGSGINTFSAACGADAKCEGKVVNDVCGTAKKCDSNGQCVSSGCTSDAHCTDPSKPKCNTATGECVECLSNDITYNDANTNNDRSSVCLSLYPGGSKPVCGADFKCREPFPCSTNADCIPGECCTADSSLGGYADLPGRGKCVGMRSAEGLRQPYLCAS